MATIALHVLLLVAGFALVSCRGPSESRSPVATAGENTGEQSQAVAATGLVEGLHEADVCARIPGRIVRFEFDEGDRIGAGTAVVHLEDQALRAGLKQAEATAWDSCSNFERLRVLSKQGVVSASELQHAEADCARRKAEAEQAAVMLRHSTIRAPFAGTLIRKFKEVGETVSADDATDPVFRLADLSGLKVTAEVPEADIARVRLGQVAAVSADAYLGASFPATVSRTALAAGRKKLRSDDPRERFDEKVVEVELELAHTSQLRSGMTVDVTIDTDGLVQPSAPPPAEQNVRPMITGAALAGGAVAEASDPPSRR